jgi:hypothetical protein
MFAEAKLVVVSPDTVRAPPDTERPEPVRSFTDSPFTMRLVVLAVMKEAYVVEERAKRLTPENEL